MPTFKLTKLTKKRLAAVRDQILLQPETLEMDSWVICNDAIETDRRLNPRACGTTACIAGWYAKMLPAKERPKGVRVWEPLAQALKLKVKPSDSGGPYFHSGDAAGKLYETVVLDENWPVPFANLYKAYATDIYLRAGIAAQRIQHLIDRGE